MFVLSNRYKYNDSPAKSRVCRKKQDFVFLRNLSANEMRTYHDIPRPEFTPERITELRADEIFVFGSNLAGMHGGGAAYQAFRSFGAVMGCGVGLQGQSYAIPTMQGGVETIKPYVDAFIGFAKAHPERFIIDKERFIRKTYAQPAL